MTKFNDWLAQKITDIFGTMGMFYFCIILVAIPFEIPNLMPSVQFISSGIIQLVALPLLSVQGKRDAKRNQELHDAAMEDRATDRETLKAIHEVIKEVHELHTHLHSLLSK